MDRVIESIESGNLLVINDPLVSYGIKSLGRKCMSKNLERNEVWKEGGNKYGIELNRRH